MLGSSALIATLIGLVVTVAVSDGLSISGALTWVLATVIVWAAALVAGLVLPAIFVKKAVTNTVSGGRRSSCRRSTRTNAGVIGPQAVAGARLKVLSSLT